MEELREVGAKRLDGDELVRVVAECKCMPRMYTDHRLELSKVECENFHGRVNHSMCVDERLPRQTARGAKPLPITVIGTQLSGFLMPQIISPTCQPIS